MHTEETSTLRSNFNTIDINKKLGASIEINHPVYLNTYCPTLPNQTLKGNTRKAINEVRNSMKINTGGIKSINIRKSSNFKSQKFSDHKVSLLAKHKEISIINPKKFKTIEIHERNNLNQNININSKNKLKIKSSSIYNSNLNFDLNNSFQELNSKNNCEPDNMMHQLQNQINNSPVKSHKHQKSFGYNEEKKMIIDTTSLNSQTNNNYDSNYNFNTVEEKFKNQKHENDGAGYFNAEKDPISSKIKPHNKNQNITHVQNSQNHYTQPQSNANMNNYSKFIPILQKYEKCIPLEYIPEIWKNLKDSENCLACMPKFEALSQQTDINFDMRAILLDWIIDVHKNYRLFPETLYMCISIIDRFLAKKPILRNKLQLLGTTSLFIASKYEEIVYPCIEEFTKVTDDAYTKEEVLQMETEIFKELNFDLTYPSAYRFFEIIGLNYNFSEVEFYYGCYLLEYFLISPSSGKFYPSIIALAVVLLILKLKKYDNYKDLYNLTDSLENQRLIKECAKEIYEFPNKCKNFNLHSVYNKYSSSQYHCVAINELDNHHFPKN